MNKNTILVLVGGIILVGVSYVLIFNNSENNEAATPAPVSSNGDNVQLGSGMGTLPVEPAAANARKDLALKLAVEEKGIVILNIEEKTWTDGCLGLGGMAESCLMAMVSGFQVTLQSGSKQYVYRTDKQGNAVRQDEVATNASASGGIINGAQ